MKKRFLLLFLCAALLVAIVPTALTASAIEVEGDWTTYRFANEYDDPNEPFDPDSTYIYRPEAGYHYTDEGFSVIPAEYTGWTPAMTVVTKEAQAVKEGIYLQFRVDDFSYDGGRDADEWIALTLNTQEKVCPGSTHYGGGWMALIRGKGDGGCKNELFLTDPATQNFQGTFMLAGSHELSVPVDEQGREIYTLEITWDGSAYEMKLNGQIVPGGEETTALLEKLDPNGDFYVGINMQTSVKDGTAALTILKYGTCEANATVPVGDDSKYPDEGCQYPIIPSDGIIPPNQPAILWKPEVNANVNGYNCDISVLGDRTWRISATATDPRAFMIFSPKQSQYYLAEDFPVFGIMFRNIWVDSGTLWYAAGDVQSAQSNCTVPFSIYDGEFYGANGEYVFVPIDLTNLWQGRIHMIRLDWYLPDSGNHEFDICFAGMFRSVEEAYVYANEYVAPVCGGLPVITEPSTEPEPDVETAPTYDYPVDVVTPAVEDTEKVSPEETTVAEDDRALQDVMKKYGCAGTVTGSAILMLLMGVAVLRKKED